MFLKFIFSVFIMLPLIANATTVETGNTALKNKIERFIEKKKKATDEEILVYIKELGYYVSELSRENGKIKPKNPILWDTFFKGNVHFSAQSLKKSIVEATYTPKIETFPFELKNLLQKFYQKKGYHFVQINVKTLTPSSRYNKKLLVEIDEGEKVKLIKATISGAKAPFKRKQLLQKLKSYSGSPITRGYFSADSLKSGVLSLQNDLKNLGYFQSKFVISSLNFNKKNTTAKAYFDLDLGKPTKIEKINFIGVKNSEPGILKSLLGLDEKDTLNLYTLEDGIKLIEDYYYSRGFLDVFIPQDNIVSYSNNLESATLNIEILERHQTIVDDIQIVGLKKTKAYVVYNELKFEPGQVLTLDKITNSNKNLQSLGIFSNVSIKPTAKKEDSDFQTVVVSLQERKPGSFTVGAGINTELGLTAKTFLQVDYANLWGTARSISSQLELSRNLRDVNFLEYKASISYTEPYFIGKNVDAKINLSFLDEIWNFDDQGSETLVTLIESNRVDLILESQLNKNAKLTFNVLSFDKRRESELERRFIPINEFIASFGPRIEFDYRDQPFTTRKGTLTEIQMEYATPLLGSNTNSRFGKFDLEFLQIQSSFAFYKPLGRNLILAQAFRGGYLYNFSESDSDGFTPFPISRAFFLGGASTVRGFDPSRGNERIPNDATLESGGQTVNGQTLGGGLFSIPASSHYYLSKTEFRFPMSKNSNFWGTLFYDGGSVQIQSGPNIDPWRHSIGLGLRYITPLGPLFNIEIAYKLDRKSEFNESAAQIHLSVASF